MRRLTWKMGIESEFVKEISCRCSIGVLDGRGIIGGLNDFKTLCAINEKEARQ